MEPTQNTPDANAWLKQIFENEGNVESGIVMLNFNQISKLDNGPVMFSQAVAINNRDGRGMLTPIMLDSITRMLIEVKAIDPHSYDRFREMVISDKLETFLIYPEPPRPPLQSRLKRLWKTIITGLWP